MDKTFLSALLIFLLALSVTAQESDQPHLTPDPERADRAMMGLMMDRFTNATFEEDPSGLVMLVLGKGPGEEFLPGFRKEFGITDEQVDHLEEALQGRKPENMEEMDKWFEAVASKITEDVHYVLTEDEEAVIDSFACYALQAANASVADALTDEQIQKMDGMVLALTGGIESPFFNERHMDAINMTEEQKAQFKAINDELKPERAKVIAAFRTEVERMIDTDEISFKGVIAAISQLRGFSGDLKKRRMAILTDAQIAKIKTLSKLPNSFSVLNLLPQWIPGPGAWQPGSSPAPERVVPAAPSRFPRGEN